MQNWLTYPVLQGIAASTLTAAKVMNTTLSATIDNTANLIGKCADIVLFTGVFDDEFPELDGGSRPYGSYLEETRALPARSYPVTRAGAGSAELAPVDPVFTKPAYDYVLEEREFPISERYNDFQGVVNDEAKFSEFVASRSWSIASGVNLYKNEIKREMIGRLAKAADDVMGTSTAWATSTAYTQGAYVAQGGKIYVCVIAHTSGTFADDLAAGYWIEEHLVSEVAKPVDASTGENFIIAAKNAVSDAMHIETEGNSLNGVMLGRVPTDTLVLYVLDEIKHNIDVKTLAGAFHEDRLNVNVEIKGLSSLGSECPTDVYAILLDTKGVKLCPHVSFTMQSPYARSGWITISRHEQPMPFISRNTFVKIFKIPA